MKEWQPLEGFRFGAGEWWALGAAISFAGANVLTRIAAVEGDALAGTVIRVVPLALFGLGGMVVRRKQMVQLAPRDSDFIGWRQVALILLYGTVVAPLAHVWLFLSFRYGGVLVAVPFFSTFPLFGALIAVPFLGEAFNRRIGAGIVLSLGGITLLTYGQQIGVPVSELWALGALYGLLTGLVWAISSNIGGYLLRRRVDIYGLIGVTMSLSVIVLVAILTVQSRLSGFGSFSIQGYTALLFAGILLGIAQFCLFRAFALTSIASASTVKVLDVVIAAAIAVAWLGEVLNAPIALGIVGIVAGVVIVQLATSRTSTAGEGGAASELAEQQVAP